MRIYYSCDLPLFRFAAKEVPPVMYKPPRTPRRQLALSLQLVADELDNLLWDFTLETEDRARFYSFRIYDPGRPLEPDTLYILNPSKESCRYFPASDYPYLSIGDWEGAAEHICVRGQDFLAVVNILSHIFQRFRDFEAELNWILNHGGDLDTLCAAATAYLQNPVYLHDSVFAILALPCHVEGMLELDYNPETGKYFIPLWLVEDFKFSEGYRETLRQTRAAIWGTNQYPYHMRSLYVNIWDINYYRARLLVNELHVALRPSDGLLLEYLADYVLLILRRDDIVSVQNRRDLVSTLQNLIATGEADRRDLQILMTTLGWRETGRFLMAKLQSQEQRNAVTSITVLRSSLSAAFPEAFIFFYERQLCMVTDLNASGLDQPAFRSRLAPFLRDSLMYAGVSLPVDGILDLNTAYIQANYAMERAFRMRGHQWCVSFDSCALEYLLSHVETPTPLSQYLAPVPRFLRQYDLEHGSQYYATLRAFLQNERSIPKTAAALIIHRTTLLYRLEKIISLTKIDLDDEAARLYLQLSFHLSEEPFS